MIQIFPWKNQAANCKIYRNKNSVVVQQPQKSRKTEYCKSLGERGIDISDEAHSRTTSSRLTVEWWASTNYLNEKNTRDNENDTRFVHLFHRQ